MEPFDFGRQLVSGTGSVAHDRSLGLGFLGVRGLLLECDLLAHAGGEGKGREMRFAIEVDLREIEIFTSELRGVLVLETHS